MAIGTAIVAQLDAFADFFRQPAAAGGIVAALVLAAIALGVLYYVRTAAPALSALAPLGVGEDGSVGAALQARAGRSAPAGRLAEALGRPDRAGFNLADIAGPNVRWLSIAADTLIAAGIAVTLLGLVGALRAAAGPIAAAADRAASQAALAALAIEAAVQFYAAITGVVCAAVLRLWQAILVARLSGRLHARAREIAGPTAV